MRGGFAVAVVTGIIVAEAPRSAVTASGLAQAPDTSARPAPERTVPVVVVTSGTLERTVALPGDLVAFQDVAVHARVQGFIQAIEVDRGSAVRRGSVLARIDAPELTAHLSEAAAKVQAAEAQAAADQSAFVSEQATFDRLKQAATTPGAVAGNDVEIAQQRVLAAKARVDAAAKQVEAARQAAQSVREIEGYLVVTAPFDGVVTERSAHTGSLVGPRSDSIVRMQQLSPLRLVAALPEAYVAGVTAGQPVEFSVTAYPGEIFSGRLARLARALDPKTRTMAIELDVNNSAGRLAPGMFAELRWPARRTAASLFVPGTAVAVTTGRTFVVRVRDGTAEWVDVKRGSVMAELIEVFGNLKPGDQIAVRGTDEIRPGARVRAAQQGRN